MIYNFFISIFFCFLINFFLICCLNIIIRLDDRFIFCVNSLFLLSFSFTGSYRLIKFKDNLRTIEPRFPKNLRTNKARSDFTGPYKKKVYITVDPLHRTWFYVVVIGVVLAVLPRPKIKHRFNCTKISIIDYVSSIYQPLMFLSGGPKKEKQSSINSLLTSFLFLGHSVSFSRL